MHFDHLYFSMLSLALKEYQFMTNLLFNQPLNGFINLTSETKDS